MSSLIRAFIAVPLPETIRCQAARLQLDLAGVNPFKISWTQPQNLHITLKFLGDTEPRLLQKAQQALQEIAFPAFTLSLRDIGCFPHAASPRVVYWEVLDPVPGLKQLQQTIDARLKPLGFPKERRAFKPHLTLGRIRERAPQPLQGVYIHPQPESIPVVCFYLMRSDLNPAGSRYTVLETYAGQG